MKRRNKPTTQTINGKKIDWKTLYFSTKNTKRLKGTYATVKINNRYHHYKVPEDEKTDEYVKRILQGNRKKPKAEGKKKQTKQKRKTKTQQTRKPLEPTLKTGMWKTTINNPNGLTSNVTRYKKQMLGKIIKDKDIIDIISQRENMQKINPRMEYLAEFYEGNKRLATAKRMNTDIETAIRELQSVEMNGNVDPINPSGDALRTLGENKTWNINRTKEGTITRIKMTWTFRKNK